MLGLQRHAGPVWLAAGLVAGLAVGSLLPDAPLHAVATDRLENFAVATGPVDENVEAIYFLDVLTGTLKAAVVSNQTPGFQTRAEANLNADLQKAVAAVNARGGGGASRPAVQVPTAPNYVMVTGQADLRRGGPQRARPSLALVYVAETNTGIVLAYVLHWDQSAHSANQPNVALLTLWAYDQFTTALVRSPQAPIERGTAYVEITVNGRTHHVPDGTTVAGLLQSLELATRHVAVEVNLELVPRAAHAEHRLAAGDRVEIVTLVGGG